MRTAHLLAVALLSLPAAAAALPAGTARLASRDTISAEAPERIVRLRLFAGGSLRARVSAHGGLTPSLSLTYPGGEGHRTPDAVASADPRVRGGRTAVLSLPTLPDGTSGTSSLAVSGTGEGSYELVVRARPPKLIRRSGVVVPAGQDVVLTFPGDTRTAARVRVTPRTDATVASVRVDGPSGAAEDGAGETIAAASAAGRAARVELTRGLGDYSLVLRGGDEPAVVDVDVALRAGLTPQGVAFGDTNVAPGFEFGASRLCEVSVDVARRDGTPRAGTVVRVLTPEGDLLDVGATDATGRCSLRADVPWGTDRVVVRCEAVGMVCRREVDVTPAVEVSFR